MKTLFVAFVQVLLLTGAIIASDLEVPFELDSSQGLILVRGLANRASALLLLDTGASRTILRSELVGSGDKLLPSRFSDGGPGLHARGRWREATLQLGQKVWRNRSVVAMNFDEVSRAYGRTIDGLIGQDLLREFDRVTIDFRARKIVFAKGKRSPSEEGGGGEDLPATASTQ